MADNPSGPPASQAPPVVVRKFPAPCWSQDETLALIHAYQDKWFSLRRRNLRTADWEAVAEEVNRRCPNQSLPKTSAQCRHKMEKLRKRYRTEKQRISNLPHNSSRLGLGLFPASSWVFFDLMDAMEIGSVSNNNMNMNMNMNVKEEEEEKVGRSKEDLGKYFDDILMSVGKGPIKFKLKNNHHNNNTTTTTCAPPPPPPAFDNINNRFFDYDATATATASGSSRFKRKSTHQLNGCSFKRPAKPSPSPSPSPAVGDMVASINLLGDGLLKMEKMKLELMQDLHRQRMQMDLHNTKIILDSQHSILNAFLQGFTKLKSTTYHH